MEPPWTPPEVIELPITDELDLHPFRPRELGGLLDDYLAACVERRLSPVRLVHGKGTGSIRKSVHAILGRDPRVVRFELCGAGHGSWGATRAWLRLPSVDPAAPDAAAAPPAVPPHRSIR